MEFRPYYPRLAGELAQRNKQPSVILPSGNSLKLPKILQFLTMPIVCLAFLQSTYLVSQTCVLITLENNEEHCHFQYALIFLKPFSLHTNTSLIVNGKGEKESVQKLLRILKLNKAGFMDMEK